jgi:hypothetical protein
MASSAVIPGVMQISIVGGLPLALAVVDATMAHRIEKSAQFEKGPGPISNMIIPESESQSSKTSGQIIVKSVIATHSPCIVIAALSAARDIWNTCLSRIPAPAFFKLSANDRRRHTVTDPGVSRSGSSRQLEHWSLRVKLYMTMLDILPGWDFESDSRRVTVTNGSSESLPMCMPVAA